jgi:hypothetical protein
MASSGFAPEAANGSKKLVTAKIAVDPFKVVLVNVRLVPIGRYTDIERLDERLFVIQVCSSYLYTTSFKSFCLVTIDTAGNCADLIEAALKGSVDHGTTLDPSSADNCYDWRHGF